MLHSEKVGIMLAVADSALPRSFSDARIHSGRLSSAGMAHRIIRWSGQHRPGDDGGNPGMPPRSVRVCGLPVEKSMKTVAPTG